MRYLIVLTFCAVLFACQSGQDFRIVPFESMTNRHKYRGPLSSGKARDSLYYTEYFLMYNFKDNQVVEKKINQFICENRDSNFMKYVEYDLVFYNYSEVCNEDYMRTCICEFPEDQDEVFYIRWHFGKFYYFRKTLKHDETVELKFAGCK